MGATCESSLFSELFVRAGRVDEKVANERKAAQQRRLAADYEARRIEASEAAETVEAAHRFVAAVEAALKSS